MPVVLFQVLVSLYSYERYIWRALSFQSEQYEAGHEDRELASWECFREGAQGRCLGDVKDESESAIGRLGGGMYQAVGTAGIEQAV